MASSTSTSNIEQDWQEVDDAGSVHSLSSNSDGELVEHSDNDDDKELVDLGRSNTTLKATLPHRPARASDDTKAEAVERPSDPSRITINSLIHEREADQVRSDTEVSPVAQSPSTDFGTQQDVVTFSNRLSLLRGLLKDVVRETAGHMKDHVGFRTPILYKLHDTVRMLQEQMDELYPIVKACAEHFFQHNRKSYMDPADLPLSANLPQWSDELRTSLLGFQVQMDSQLQMKGSSGRFSPTPASPVSGFSNSADNLERLRLAMADFLPIIKVDYGEFRTNHMSMPTSPTPTPGRKRSGGVDPTVSALRQAFYGLRDELRQILDLIVAIHTYDLASPITSTAPAVIKSLSNLRDVVMLICTNNPSEWIESDLNTKRKIISYPAFIALSPDVLYDVRSSLQQVREDLDVPVDKDTPQRMVYHHQIVLLTEAGQLQEIQSTVDFLLSLLVPGNEDGEATKASTS